MALNLLAEMALFGRHIFLGRGIGVRIRCNMAPHSPKFPASSSEIGNNDGLRSRGLLQWSEWPERSSNVPPSCLNLS
ncbi:hypothetical protein H6P81_018421 [Aristolochia fimbriata]|uniref:Uncharacterized protein n=1 Tax=Aristolochia fimbriata TaxID=158543 RepID=A0AAV7E1B7_ARIFI|nr:hypothetical protein H6P81_018421 [Aristolochia fimbriata]